MRTCCLRKSHMFFQLCLRTHRNSQMKMFFSKCPSKSDWKFDSRLASCLNRHIQDRKDNNPRCVLFHVPLRETVFNLREDTSGLVDIGCIVDCGYNKCCIGSTCESLSQRMARHRQGYVQSLKETYPKTITAYLLFDDFSNFSIKNCKIE